MADPHHTPVLDGFDRLTVRLYRLGLGLSAIGVLIASLSRLVAVENPADAWVLVNTGVALAAANMHLYAKQIRWVIGAACFTGLVLQAFATSLPAPGGSWVLHGGLGFVFVSLSGFALKEQFCFRIPLLRAVPLFLAASLVPLTLGMRLAAGIVLLPAGATLLLLAVRKAGMPLHFDIGDKSRYQV